MESESSIPLSVTLELARAEPLSLSVGVTNNGTGPVTVLTWNSPLDPLVVQLGLLSFTPHAASKPLDLPTILVKRQMPPSRESLVVLEQGERRSQVVEVPDIVVSKEELFGKDKKATVRCEGRWTAVWLSRAEKLGEEALMELGAGPEAMTGEFQSEDLAISSS